MNPDASDGMVGLTPPPLPEPGAAADVRQALDAAGYHTAGLRELAGQKLFLVPDEIETVRWRYLTRRAGPLDVLVRLFLLRAGVSAGAAERALGAATLDRFRRARLLSDSDGRLRATHRVMPFDDLLLTCDWSPTPLRPLHADAVLGAGRASETLASMTVRRACGRVLDLGTGCGVQSFLAARHARHVVATDCNPRALSVAAFNASLNGLPQVDFRHGDFFSPVQGESFDLIVSNPPFVISPESRFVYRDGGLPLDDLCRRVAREAPGYLSEGGFFQMLCNWAHVADQPWEQRLKGWFDDSGCDVWVIRMASQEVDAYALQWLRDERAAPARVAARFGRWQRYYRRQRIEAISSGLVTMRKRAPAAGGNWFRCDDGPDAYAPGCGEAILNGFSRRDWLLARQHAGDLLDLPLRVSPDLRLVRDFTPAAGEWRPGGYRIQLTKGLAYACTLDAHVAALVARCDGRRTVRTIIREIAESAHKPVEQLTTACLGVIEELVDSGFVLPRGPQANGTS